MRIVQKILLSLLFATVLFGAFAVAAFSGLFDYIDTRYYNQRVRDNSSALLQEAQTELNEYLSEFESAFQSFVADSAMRNVFLINQSRQDVERQQELTTQLLDRYPEIDFMRFVDNQQGRIWFSTLDSDVRDRTDLRVEYKPNEDLAPPISVPPELNESNQVAWIPDRSAIQIAIPAQDSFDIPRGVAVTWVGLSGVYNRLLM